MLQCRRTPPSSLHRRRRAAVRFREMTPMRSSPPALHSRLTRGASDPDRLAQLPRPSGRSMTGCSGSRRRRKPATYAHTEHIAGPDHRPLHGTRQQVPAGLPRGVVQVCRRTGHAQIWAALHAQMGETAPDIMTPAIGKGRAHLLPCGHLSQAEDAKALIEAFRTPQESPEACVFAQTRPDSRTTERRITPAGGGSPDAGMRLQATDGMEAVAGHKLERASPVGPLLVVLRGRKWETGAAPPWRGRRRPPDLGRTGSLTEGGGRGPAPPVAWAQKPAAISTRSARTRSATEAAGFSAAATAKVRAGAKVSR